MPAAEGGVVAARAAGEEAVVSVAVRHAVECRVAGARADVREAAPVAWRGGVVVADREVAGWPGGAVADDPEGEEAETLEAPGAAGEWLIAVRRSVVAALAAEAASAVGRASVEESAVPVVLAVGPGLLVARGAVLDLAAASVVLVVVSVAGPDLVEALVVGRAWAAVLAALLELHQEVLVVGQVSVVVSAAVPALVVALAVDLGSDRKSVV